MNVKLFITLLTLLQFTLVFCRSGPNARRHQHQKRLQKDVYPSIIDDPKLFSQSNFTHVIVGGGTAGLALAVRLSEVSAFRVGVIEAGVAGFEDPINTTPGLFGANLGTKYDWQYVTQTSTKGIPSIKWPRGRVLGGSSVLNFMVWDRASTVEYDAWEELGNVGWNAELMFKYIHKAERLNAPRPYEGTSAVTVGSLGTSGLVDISFPRYVGQLLLRWLPALLSLGIPVNKDSFNGNKVGASIQPNDINFDKGTRSSSDVAYLLPNAHRSNLLVLTSATAVKINWAAQSVGSDKVRASSVTYVGKDNVVYSVNALQEVILSCGTVNTPKLLEMSGIGSQPILARAGVPQVVALAGVGENLQDHVYASLLFRLVPGVETYDSYRVNATFQAAQKALYEAGQPSILATATDTVASLTLSMLYKNSSKVQQVIANAKAEVDDFESPYNVTIRKQLEMMIEHQDKIGQLEVIGLNGFYATTGRPDNKSTYTTLLAAPQHLFSRGSIHIISNDVDVKPIITPNYFSFAFDREILRAGTTFLRSIAATSAYAKRFVQAEVTPGATVKDVSTYVLNTFSSEYHPIGTASMLPRQSGGVVDEKLVVYGTTNVRVVDASIIPLHISAHLQATVYAIAEIAADIVKGILF